MLTCILPRLVLQPIYQRRQRLGSLQRPPGLAELGHLRLRHLVQRLLVDRHRRFSRHAPPRGQGSLALAWEEEDCLKLGAKLWWQGISCAVQITG